MSVEYFRVARPLIAKSQTTSSARAALTRVLAPLVGQPLPVPDFPTLLIEWLPGEGPFVTDGLWSNITSYCTEGTIQRGRQYELDRFGSGTCSLTLRSTTRLFDPDNTASAFYPNIVPMRQLRIRATYKTANGLVLDGAASSFAATPDAVPLRISGDFEGRARIAPTTWTPPAERKIFSKEGGAGAGYALSIMPSGVLRFVWFLGTSIQIVDSTVAPSGVAAGVPTWVRVTRTVANGEVRFFQSTNGDGNTWTQIGNPVVSVPGGGIQTSSDSLVVGATPQGALRFVGTIHYVELRNGLGGTIVASPNTQPQGTALAGSPPFTDLQGNVWTLTGNATIPQSDTVYPLFRGYITDWGNTVAADNVFFTTITVRDAFALLEMTELPSSSWALEMQQSAPTMWMRLGETDTARVTDSSDGGNYGLYDNVEQGVDGLVPNDDDGAVAGTPPDSRVWIQNPSLITGFPFTIGFLFQLSPDNPTHHHAIFTGLIDVRDAEPGLRIYIEYSGGGTPGNLVAYMQNGSGVLGRISAAPVADGTPHYAVIRYTNSTTCDMFIDGALFQAAGGWFGPIGWFGNVPTGWHIGNYTDVYWGDYNFIGTLDEVSVWNGAALSDATIARLSIAAKNGWDGDDSGVRVNRFLDAIAWPSVLRNVQNGIAFLQPAQWSAGSNALEVMQGWADTELGAFFVNQDGALVWRNRHYPLLNRRATTPCASFIDGNTTSPGIRYLADGFELLRDEQLIRNPVQASRVNGVTVQVKDDTYRTKYGNRTWQAPQSEERNDAVVRDRATWLLGRYKELGTRLGSMHVRPRRDPGRMWPQALGLDIGDRITVRRKPLGLDNEIVTDQIIETVEHTFSATHNDWVTSYVGSPVDPTTNMYMILDDPAFGRLDSFRLAY